MVKHTLRAVAATGDVAIIEGDDIVNPFDDPFNHLDKLKFHSGLGYPKIIQSFTTTLSLASTNSSYQSVTHTLFAHGLAGVPAILGITEAADGNVAAVTGHVPIQSPRNSISGPGSAKPTSYCHHRWLSVAADATNVYAIDFSTACQGNSRITNHGYNATTIPLTVYVIDRLVA